MPAPPQKKIPPAAPPVETFDLLGLLVNRRTITTEQADRVRRSTKVNGLPTEQALAQLGFANEVTIAQALAAEAGLPYVKLNPLDLDLDVVTKGIAGPFARKHGMVAISKSAEKQLRQSRISTVDLGNQEFLSRSADDLDPAAAPVVKALDHIMTYAFEQRASDIHFEPKRDLALVRLRIDGILHDVHLIPRIVYEAVVSRIKLLSGANLAEKRRPQDGRIKREQGGREVELRVSTMPVAFGEKVVLRIFDPDVLLKSVD